MSNGFVFDADDIKEGSGSFPVIVKDGTYDLTCIDGRIKTAQSSGREYLELDFRLEGATSDTLDFGEDVVMPYRAIPKTFGLTNFLKTFFPERLKTFQKTLPEEVIGKKCRGVVRLKKGQIKNDGEGFWPDKSEIVKLLRSADTVTTSKAVVQEKPVAVEPSVKKKSKNVEVVEESSEDPFE